ncbi:MAG TPA: hypothetical protein VM686_00300 [Polyangiaceae bacterium]|nr:hypothetical protein [Polyangiaceae bacterium]
MTPWRVWFSAVGASQEPRRPWAVKHPDGRLFLAAEFVAVAARSSFVDTAFQELPGGPRGILECDDVVLVEPIPWSGT